jgi:hypothetical protein
MSKVRNAIESFVSGTLDYGALQTEFEAAARSGTPRDLAFDELRVVDAEIGLSPALNNLIARAIDRHFATAGGEHTRTVPGDRGDVTAPGRPPAADADEATGRTSTAPAADAATAPAAGVHRPAAEVSGQAPESDAAQPAEPETDPVGDLPPIFAARDALESDSPPAFEPQGPVALPEPGTVLADRYVLQSVLGRGGIGVVYRALDRRREEAAATKPFVALKVLRRDLQGRAEARSRLFTEALQGLSLQHPNIVAIHDFDRDGELAFVTMELLEGERLRSTIVRSAPAGLPTRQAFEILRGILAAAGHLHARGFVHRDLTPANILVTNDGVPKLLDFGLTRRPVRGGQPALGGGADDHGHTPAYASPELLDGKPPDPRDDVYSLGVLTYELLTSRHPFAKLAADEASRQHKRPAAPKGLSPGQWRTLRSALSFDADRRPADARAFLDGMALDPPSSAARGPGVVPGLLAGTAAGVLLTLAVIHPQGPIGRRLTPPETGAEAQIPATVAPEAVQPPALSPAAGTGGEDAAATAEEASPSTGIVPERSANEATEAAEPPPTPAARTAGADVLTPPGGAPVPTSSAGGAESTAAAASSAPSSTARSEAPAAPPDPRPGRLELSAGVYRVNEATAVVIADVVRRDGTRGRVGFRWRTVPRSAGDGDDYVGVDWQRLELADGEEVARIFVPLVNDGLAEDPETFLIEIAQPDGGATLGERSRAEVRIVDDDPA